VLRSGSKPVGMGATMGTTATRRDGRAGELDRLARQILEGLAPLEFRPAATAAEVDETFRLRGAAVAERGWASAEATPGGRERDEHDAVAIPLVCLDGDAVVGTMRLVPPLPGRLLPTERDFDLRIDPPGTAVDAGRVVVAPSHRGSRGHLVMAGLAARAWIEARALGLERIVGVGSERAIGLYQGLGMTVTTLGPSRLHWGEERSPIEIAGAEDALPFVRVDRQPAADEEAGAGDEDPPAGVSRRGLLAQAGGVAAGVLLVGLPEAAAGQTAARRIGSGPTDRRTIDFILRIDQSGRDLAVRGWLTRVQGLRPAQLQTGPVPLISTDPAAADPSTRRLVVVMTARLQSISALGSAITGHGTGRAEIHLLRAGGARFEDPASFSGGTTLATFTASFQHSLAIDDPDRAVATFTADFLQRSARVVSLDGRRVQLGRPALPWSVRASGRGVRTDAATPRSEFFLSGDLGVVDAADTR
jgi:N-acyl-L-homoserine lactone synthetase